MTQWSPQQSRALDDVGKWLKDVSDKTKRKGEWKQIFRLFGYAGTGKTTLAKHLAKDLKRVFFMAYTGKAAHVLRKKGCEGASTIHRSIYMVDPDSKPGELNFILNVGAYCQTAELIIVDEVSMVNEEIGRDLMSFGVPILVLGDPAQLPPVSGTGFFINGQPDVLLTEVHRQAEDNPIIKLATMVRQHKYPPGGSYGNSMIVRKVDDEVFLEADQILVGRSKTRADYNRHARHLLSRLNPSQMPVVDDKLICLKNNHRLGFLNGAMYIAAEVEDISGFDELDEKPRIPNTLFLQVKPDDDERVIPITAWTGYFCGVDIPAYGSPDNIHMDYGYAITTHKSQGSEWENVAILDESFVFRDQRWKWLYTAITRASEKLTLITRM